MGDGARQERVSGGDRDGGDEDTRGETDFGPVPNPSPRVEAEVNSLRWRRENEHRWRWKAGNEEMRRELAEWEEKQRQEEAGQKS